MAFRGGKLHTHGISNNNNENIGVSTSREPNLYDEEQDICHVGSVKLVCTKSYHSRMLLLLLLEFLLQVLEEKRMTLVASSNKGGCQSKVDMFMF